MLLGHTRDDQAETVLLALARGAGPRGLAGMPARRELAGVPLLRPLLDVARAADPGGLRGARADPVGRPAQQRPGVRPRPGPGRLLPALVGALGPGVVDNLARTARLLAADTAAATTLICALIAFPVAYAIALYGGRFKSVLIAAIVVPFFASYLIRMYAWSALLSPTTAS